jgi:hypothetical protein
VKNLLEKAKINECDLIPIVQNIYLGPNLTSDEYKLLEIDEDKLEYLKQGNR